MKSNCKALRLSLLLSLLFLLLTCIFSVAYIQYNDNVLDILLNISISLFGSSIVVFLLNISAYNVSKNQVLNKYFNEIERLIRCIDTINYLFCPFDEDKILSYISEINKKKIKLELNRIDGFNFEINDEKIKEELIYEYVNKYSNLNYADLDRKKLKYYKAVVEREIDNFRTDSNNIFDQYINLSNESVYGAVLLLDDICFFSGKKHLNNIKNKTIEPIYNLLCNIKDESYHFRLLKNNEGNEMISVEKLFELQKSIFNVKKYNNSKLMTISVYGSLVEKLQYDLERIRSDVLNTTPMEIRKNHILTRVFNKSTI